MKATVSTKWSSRELERKFWVSIARPITFPEPHFLAVKQREPRDLPQRLLHASWLAIRCYGWAHPWVAARCREPRFLPCLLIAAPRILQLPHRLPSSFLSRMKSCRQRMPGLPVPPQSLKRTEGQTFIPVTSVGALGACTCVCVRVFPLGQTWIGPLT